MHSDRRVVNLVDVVSRYWIIWPLTARRRASAGMKYVTDARRSSRNLQDNAFVQLARASHFITRGHTVARKKRRLSFGDHFASPRLNWFQCYCCHTVGLQTKSLYSNKNK